MAIKPCKGGPAHDLILAAGNGSAKGIRKAVKAGAHVDGHCECSIDPPLIYAILSDSIPAIRTLVKLGVDVNCLNGDKMLSALGIAAGDSYDAAVYELLNAGADPNFACSAGYTALHFVKSPTCARLLIAAGATVDANARKSTPLQSVVGLGVDLQVVKVLVEAGADIHASLNEWPAPYQKAKAQDHDEIAAYLLSIMQQEELQLAGKHVQKSGAVRRL